LQKQIYALTQQMQLHAGPARARLRAFALTDRSLNGQAQLWAYVDDFRYLALRSVCFACFPVPTGGKEERAWLAFALACRRKIDSHASMRDRRPEAFAGWSWPGASMRSEWKSDLLKPFDPIL
jgi:hypothetical protein